MPAPSRLAIATGALQRLVREEASYHRELEQQRARIAQLESGGKGDAGGDDNAEFMLRQENQAMQETMAVFPSLRERIRVALDKLEAELTAAGKEGQNSNVEEITQAKEAVSAAKTSYREIA